MSEYPTLGECGSLSPSTGWCTKEEESLLQLLIELLLQLR